MPDIEFCPHCGGPLSAPPTTERKMATPNMEARAQGFLDGCAGVMDACRFTLPVSPSTNHLYRGSGKRFRTAAYVNWQHEAGWTVKAQRPVPLKGRLRVLIEAPFSKARDIDNVKPILDLVQSLGIIENDNRVDELVVRRIAVGQDMVVSLWPM